MKILTKIFYLSITVISGIIAVFFSYQYLWEPRFREYWLEREISRASWQAILTGFLIALIVNGFLYKKFTPEGLKDKKNWIDVVAIVFVVTLLIWRLFTPV